MNRKKILSFLFSYKKTALVFSLIAIVLIIISANFASIVRANFGTWGDSSLINACEDSRGRVTLVSSGTNCNSNETQVTWLKDVDAGSYN